MMSAQHSSLGTIRHRHGFFHPVPFGADGPDGAEIPGKKV